MSLDELKEDPVNAIYIRPIQPHNAPITLPTAGAGFPADKPPKIVFTTPDRLDIKVNVIKNEFVRCIAAKHLDFDAFKDFELFWTLQQPATDSKDYGEYGIGYYHPRLLGSEMYAPRQDIRVELIIEIIGLSMATRYTVSCATSTLQPKLTTSEDSSQILSADPIYQSTRGNTEGLCVCFGIIKIIIIWDIVMDINSDKKCISNLCGCK